MSVLTLVVSHTVGPNKDFNDIINNVIIDCIKEHPHHALWAVMPMRSIKGSSRSKLYRELRDCVVASAHPDRKDEIKEAIDDIEQFVRVALKIGKRCAKGRTPGMIDLGEKKILDGLGKRYRVIIPYHSFISNVNLAAARHETPVMVEGIYPKVKVYESNRYPTRFVVRGTDGREYPLLGTRLLPCFPTSVTIGELVTSNLNLFCLPPTSVAV